MDNIKLNPLVKKYYIIISICLVLLYIGIITILKNVGVSIPSGDQVNNIYMIAFLFLGLIGMLIDETIRKNPGYVMSYGLPVYAFSYIVLMSLSGNNYPLSYITIACYIVYVVLSMLFIKRLYPKLSFHKKGVVIFDTVLMFVVNIATLALGFHCAMVF